MEEGIKYDFFHQQTDHHLVQKYFSLRTEFFVKKWNLKHFNGEEDKYDHDAHILLLHKNGQCLGGGRIIVKNIRENIFLPMETISFQLEKELPQLELANQCYAELSRLAIVCELRNGRYSAEIYKKVGEKARSLGAKYVFASSALTQARMARIACKNVGLKLEILNKVKVPDLPTYEGHQMFLSLIDLTKVSTTEYQELEKVEDFA